MFMKNTQLTEAQIANLRQTGLVNEGEFAYQAGDLIVAEDPVTGEKRVIGKSTMLTENTKKLLKG